MKALVTGASGFIGSTLIEELGTLGFEVSALMRRTSSTANLEGLKYHRVDGDLSDLDSLCRAVQDVDYVFHLAGITTASNQATFLKHNVQGTEKLAQAVAARKSTLTRFVYVSSLAAAGPAQKLEPRIESEKDQPVSDYGESKLLGERELQKYKNLFPISIVRPPIVYGPRDKAVFRVVQTIARNFMPLLQGSTQGGHKYYSTIHAKDLCQGLVQAAVASPSKVRSGEVFYLSGDDIHTVQEFMTLVAERLNCDPLKIKIPKFALRMLALGSNSMSLITRKTLPLNLDKLKEMLPDYWICSNQKAKKMLAFSPEFDLATGIAHSIEWYKRQRWI